MNLKGCALAALLFAVSTAATAAEKIGQSQADIEAMARRFAPIELEVATDRLSTGDQKALAKLVAAARVL
ncbi:MAG TPA: hypothetical protein VJM11_18910, partial [Nevskiaceae bacterium]|nr:hypothetical protein [Nevskiaceae bacterium]